jgi:hypothetical protein
MNLFEFYDAGYLAGLEGDDACPYLAFAPHWWTWHAGYFAGHQVLSAQMEAIFHFFPQD